MYDVYESDAVDEDIEDSDDGGQCTGTYANALEMANEAALKIIRNHFSDNAFNPEICPSSLDENGEPHIEKENGEFETSHKWSEVPCADDESDECKGTRKVCDECGQERDCDDGIS